MSWSLRVRNGDFDPTSNGLAQVSNENKLVQDLRHFILEKMGTDDAHPEYGSLFDGGTKPDGTEANSVLASDSIVEAKALIEADLRRIIIEYQQTQLARAKRERLKFNKTTFTRGEVIKQLDTIRMDQVLDKLEVTIFITTASDVSLQINVPISDSPLITTS